MNSEALLLNIGLIFIVTLSIAFLSEIKGWRKSLSAYLFANRKIQVAEGAGAICVHWIWAPALFISPTIAYNYGWQGLLYFCVPNGISVMIAGYLVYKLREREESSLTNLIARDSPELATTLRLMFACVSFAALVLAFTATATLLSSTKYYGYDFDVKHVTAIAGLLAFVYTVLGGLRTSIFTGFLIFLGWIGLVFAIYTGAVNNLMGWYGATGMGELFTLSGAKKDGITNELFFASFGAAFLPLILVGASGHGMMWQKGMSMKREDILPAFFLAGFMFMLIIFMYGLAALYALLMFPYGLDNSETAGLVGMQFLIGPLGAAVFITLFLWQTLTVMDSALNYLGYVVSEDILKAKSIKESKEIMYGVMGLFVLLAWFTANMGWKIWPLFMVMSAIRTSCFSTMYYTARGVTINHRAAFIAILIAGATSTSMAIYNKFHAVPWLDFYAIMLALLLPWIVNIVDRALQKTTDIFENWN